MKTLLLFTVILGCYFAASAQGSYKSLKECNNDTIQYALTNFNQSNERYIGQPMEKFLNDLEFKIMDFFPIDHLPQNPPKSYINGIIIYADCKDLFYKKEHNHQKRFCIFINFETPYKDKAGTIFDMRREDKEWGPKYYDIFKDYIVKYMRVRVYE